MTTGAVTRGAVAGPMRLTRVVSRTFEGARAYGPELVDFLCDLTRLHGLPQREDYFGRVTRTTFTEMAQEIAAELIDGGAEANQIEPFGLAVVAHNTPDAEPGWPASYLSGALPGEPLAFAVADQGAAAPFTALRIAADYSGTIQSGTVQSGGAERRAALVLIMDQTAVVPDRRLPPGTVPPGRDHAVALAFEPAGQLAAVSVHQLTDVSPADAAAAIEAELYAGLDSATAVLGPGLAVPAAIADGRVVHAPADLPGTGLWHELARLLRRPDAAGGRILLASYEPTLGYLDLCTVSVCETAGLSTTDQPSTTDLQSMTDQRSMTGVRAA